MPRILIIEDDSAFARRLARNLGLDGFEAEVAEGPADAQRRLAAESFDALLCDIKMPGMTGLELLARIRNGQESGTDPEIPVVLLTSVNSVDTAVEAMRLGASDYLTKEAERPEIVVRLKRALEQRAMAEENRRLRATIERVDEFRELVGDSAGMARIKQDIQEVGETNASVLVLGETGVGKELVARAIHRASRREGSFIDLNCALLPNDAMFLSELFGHEKGAFTDAREQKKGKMELAHRGTLFLDEVGELSPEAQAKLLRVLETMTFTRVGGTRPITVDVRVLVATNRNLEEEVSKGRFRGDLFYRLNVFPMEIPPLRQRMEDIEPLARFFLSTTAARYSRPVPEMAPEGTELMRQYRWPGNIRELRNVCERLVIRARGGNTISAEDIRGCGISPPAAQPGTLVEIPEEGVNLDELEKSLVLEALRRSNWIQTDAAHLLGISVDRINNRVKKYGFTHPSWRVNKG